MNETPKLPEPDPSRILTPVLPKGFTPIRSQTRPLSYWLKRFLACNPFYLVSAALLLYGFYRVSIDPTFLHGETAQLAFTFTSLQFYECLLVLTAIFLAARRIWYDSNLLVGLENLLVLVPFILISQAALIQPRTVWGLSLTGGMLAVARLAGLKRCRANLYLPARLLGLGSAVLAANVALPIVFRLLHENKFGTKLAAGPAYIANEWAWLFLVPLLCGLALFLPATRPAAEAAAPPWVAPGLFSAWVAGTVVHLCCLGYIYDFDLRPELLAPGLWALCWVIRARLLDSVPALSAKWSAALLVPPFLAAGLALSPAGSRVVVVLALLNATIFGRLYFHDRTTCLPLHLALLSLVCSVGGVPLEWGSAVWAGFSREGGAGAAMAGYFLFCLALSRDPRFGVIGGAIAGVAVLIGAGDLPHPGHSAMQAMLVVSLSHSLRWEDFAHSGARGLRAVAGGLWVGHSLFWMFNGGTAADVFGTAAIVLSAWLAARLFTRRWGPWAIPVCAILVALCGPARLAFDHLQATPIGVLAVGGSFALFGLGTLTALTKHRWHRA